jgi:cell division protein FtsZ
MAIAKPKEKFQPLSANVKVIGVGGGGGHAVARMAKNFLRGVDFIAINTDHQDLDHCDVKQKLYIGKGLTKGLGAGMNPDLGRQAAEENRSEISEVVKGADLVFLAAGLGGGTGSGATPVIAEAAKQAGALTIAVVTKPFSFEGSQRERIAAESLMKLKDKVDALIVVPNDRIFTVISKDTPLMKAFEAIDDILRNALKGLVEIIAMPGIINVDFADVKNIMQDSGVTIVGVGVAAGPDRAVNAVTMALHSPLLETSPEGAKAVLLGISGGKDLKMTEINDAAKIVAQTADPGARIIFGAYHDRNLKPGQVKVTVIAAGFNGNQATALFGGGRYERQGDMFGGGRETRGSMLETFGSGSASGTGSGGMGAKKPQGQGERSSLSGSSSSSSGREAAAASRAEREADIFSSLDMQPSKAGAVGASGKKDGMSDKDNKKEKESDAWDIPAFLRRRKK